MTPTEYVDALRAWLRPRLRAARERTGLTQTAMAVRLEWERPVYGRFERCVHVPSLESLDAFARASGTPLARLLEGLERIPLPERASTEAA